MDLKGKSVLITGAGRRIGAALATAVAARGASVCIHYNRSQSQAEAVVKAIEKKRGVAYLVQGELSAAEDCARIVQETVRVFGTLHVLINNAAIFPKTPFFKTTGKEWDHILDTNLKGPFFCAQAAAAVMQSQEGGKIINIADWAAIRPYTNYVPYCISKAGVIALTVGLARTLAPKITVNTIAPGAMLLPEGLNEKEKKKIVAKTPLKRIGSPEDIVNAVLFLLEGGDFMTGSTLVVDGGQLIA